MKAKTVLFMVITFVFLLTGCEKEQKKDILKSFGVVYFSNPAVDGCGWEVRIDNKSFYPTNLSDKFKKSMTDLSDGYKTLTQKVEIEYVLLATKTKCSSAWSSSYFSDIEIISIKAIN